MDVYFNVSMTSSTDLKIEKKLLNKKLLNKNLLKKVLTSLCTVLCKDKVVKFKQFAKCFQSRKGHQDYFL